MESKICTKCNIKKEIEYFELRKDTGKYRNKCSMCNKGYQSVRRDTQENVQKQVNTRSRSRSHTNDE